MKKFLCLIGLILLPLALCGCDDGGGGSSGPAEGVDVTGTKAIQSTDYVIDMIIESGARNCVVGGTTPEERNIICGAQIGVHPQPGQPTLVGVVIEQVGQQHHVLCREHRRAQCVDEC